MSDIGRAVDAFISSFVLLAWLQVFTAPLAIWKLIDIAVWLVHHISISWSAP